jgi:hypothetical protein
LSASDNERIAYLSGDDVASLSAQERAGLDELRTVLATPATWEEPDPALEDHIVNAIASEAAAERGAEGASAAAPGGVAPAAPTTRRRSLRDLFRARPAIAFGGLAAAAAAVIAVVAVLATGSGSNNQLRFAMVLSGTSLSPGAHGSATLTKTTSGWQIRLSATGLPHIENGRFYQAWVKNSAGILVPVGTFNDARHVTLWSGVPITKFRTLTVTQQVANGNPASSGRRVLVGTISAPH